MPRLNIPWAHIATCPLKINSGESCHALKQHSTCEAQYGYGAIYWRRCCLYRNIYNNFRASNNTNFKMTDH